MCRHMRRCIDISQSFLEWWKSQISRIIHSTSAMNLLTRQTILQPIVEAAECLWETFLFSLSWGKIPLCTPITLAWRLEQHIPTQMFKGRNMRGQETLLQQPPRKDCLSLRPPEKDQILLPLPERKISYSKQESFPGYLEDSSIGKSNEWNQQS